MIEHSTTNTIEVHLYGCKCVGFDFKAVEPLVLAWEYFHGLFPNEIGEKLTSMYAYYKIYTTNKEKQKEYKEWYNIYIESGLFDSFLFYSYDHVDKKMIKDFYNKIKTGDECTKKDCSRRLTDKVKKDAVKSGLLICEYAEKPECFKGVTNERDTR
jgi:hypothetical protein